MSIPPQDALWNAVAELSQLLLHEESVNTTLQRVATSAASLIDAVEEVGMTVLHDNRPSTDAATGGIVYEVDNFQYEVDQGPCLHALLHGQPVEIASMRADQRWPTYARFAADRQIMSSLSIPLTISGQLTFAEEEVDQPSLARAADHGRIGVMNLYSRRESPFNEDERWAALTFGQQAAVAIYNAHTYDTARRLTTDLQAALGSRAAIEQAKGILMARTGCSPDDAFERLRKRSQDENRKLRDLAEELVAEVTSGRHDASRA
jgi:GAF domain-containing protein